MLDDPIQILLCDIQSIEKKSYSTKYIENNTQDREKASGYWKTFWLYYPLEMFKRSEGLPYTFQFSCSVVFDSLQTHGLQPARLLCPWNSLGQNTGVGSLSLLQGIFPTQVSRIAVGFFTSWAIRVEMLGG